MKFAMFEVKQAMTNGLKDVYTCQAYLLIAVYPVPQRRWAEDKSWALMGLAIQLVPFSSHILYFIKSSIMIDWQRN
jgi:transcriptional regulatory protein LEU3